MNDFQKEMVWRYFNGEVHAHPGIDRVELEKLFNMIYQMGVLDTEERVKGRSND